jgi:hypothetical protein
LFLPVFLTMRKTLGTSGVRHAGLGVRGQIGVLVAVGVGVGVGVEVGVRVAVLVGVLVAVGSGV